MIELSNYDKDAIDHYLHKSLEMLVAGQADEDRVRNDLRRLIYAAASDDPEFLEIIRLGVD